MSATPAEQAPTLPVGALPAAVTSLLAAIVDALDVPLADQLADDSTAAALMRQRANETRIIAASVLRDLDPRNVEGAAEQLRGWTAEAPVTYRSWQQRTAQAAAEEQQLLDAEPDDHFPGAGKKVTDGEPSPTSASQEDEVSEDEAVRRSVDRAFPRVAAFLADERGGDK